MRTTYTWSDPLMSNSKHGGAVHASLLILGACLCIALVVTGFSWTAPTPLTPDDENTLQSVAPDDLRDGGVSDENREDAEAWWRMMYNMQGIDAADSPHLASLLRKGTPAASCDEMCDHLDHGTLGKWMAPDDDEMPIWDQSTFRRLQSRTGMAPFKGDYEDYLERMAGREKGEDSCCSPDRLELPSAEMIGASLAPTSPLLTAASGPVFRILPGDASETLTAGPVDAAADDRSGAGPTPGLSSNRRTYRVTAFATDIIYNKFGDHDPEGLMYALDDDVARYQAAPALGFNAGRDPIYYGDQSNPAALAPQPLVIRANVGDEVTIVFTNSVPGQRASIYVHKGIYVDGSNGSATGFNPDGTIGNGEKITYNWKIPDQKTAEGTYYFYSHADPRYQVAHGLFGALIVEPKGSRWLDTFTGDPMHTRRDGGPTNWGAIIARSGDGGTFGGTGTNSSFSGPGGAAPSPGLGQTGRGNQPGPAEKVEDYDFREYVIFYHDRVRLVNTSGQELVAHLVPDPGGKALSYRSAPFFNVLDQVNDVNREPLAYSGYTFGDSSTPHPRWYVGDPSMMRVMHAGGGEHHVHHNHINRWRRDALVDDGIENLTHSSKRDEHDVSKSRSNRIDSQIMGPGESFNIRMEGGAGSVERSVGDILFHCHFIEHVVEGMWTYHRVYNTRQSEPADTDSTTVPGGSLAELPDRADVFEESVDSIALRDMMPFRAAVGLHKGELIDTDPKLFDFIADQLPPAKATTIDDATGWDWITIADPGGSGGELFLGEVMDSFFGPGWPAAGEGEGASAQNKTVTVGSDVRPAIKFNPKILGTDGGGNPLVDGRLAYPHLKPHLDKRPPFAPFGPTDPRFDVSRLTLPSGLYPSTTPPLTQGTPYMGPELAPTDAGYPSGLEQGGGLSPWDAPVRRFNISAITLPIQYNAHGDYDARGQIYVLAEDEQAVLSGAKPAQPLVLRVNEGDRVEYVITNKIPDNPADIVSKSTVGIHSHLVQYDVQGSDGAVAGLNYETGMQFGETVTESFYADVELGTVYQHDHQILLQSLPRGLFMALIVEPRDSTHHNPQTGQQILSGPIADIRTVDDGADGFREFAVLFNDNTKMLSQDAGFLAQSNNESRSNPETGYTSLNLRAEPLVHRAPTEPDMATAYSSTKHGDPSTDLWQAYVGDPVRIRVESAGAGSAHALMMPGHRFRHEIFNPDTDLRDFWFMGPSTTRDFQLEPGAGGALGKAGDYFYFDGDMDHREEGAWGLFRVYNTVDTNELQLLPGHLPPALDPRDTSYAPGDQVVTGNDPASAGTPSDPWPLGATVRTYDVVAIDGVVNYTPGFQEDTDAFARVFLLAEDVAAFQAGTFNPQPLVIRANAGEGIQVNLTNMLADDAVGMMPSLVGLDPRQALGATAGFNDDQTVAPGETRTYKWYADTELGVCMLSNTVNLAESAPHGLWGALIIEPADSVWLDTHTGVPLYSRLDGGPSAPQAIIDGPGGSFREGTLFFHDKIPAFQYEVAINYRIGRRESANDPMGGTAPSTGGPHNDGELTDPDENTEHSSSVHGDPPLVLDAALGDPYRLRVVQPGYHDHHSISLHGHQFTTNMRSTNSRQLGAKSLTTGSAHNFSFEAGGPEGSAHAGDFLFHCHIMDHKKVGMWGLFRVHSGGSGNVAPLP